MSHAIKISNFYTYADYLTWSDTERWEIIHGSAYNMSPAPSRVHQKVVLEIASAFKLFFKGKTCEAYIAPFDVRLAANTQDDNAIDTVVQPDISVFCDPKKLDERGAKGAPDLVVEVLSPATFSRDVKTKLLLYQQYGVREYWLVDVDKREVEILVLDHYGRYLSQASQSSESQYTSTIFDGFSISRENLFEGV